LSSTKQFVSINSIRKEVRDSSGNVLAQFFHGGETISGTNYYYTADHITSIREMTDASGVIRAQYAYDPYGKVSTLQNNQNSDFQYAGYYFHAPSALSLTLTRSYDASLGRFLNRDLIEEVGGTNLYQYALNSPLINIDPSGLQGLLIVDPDLISMQLLLELWDMIAHKRWCNKPYVPSGPGAPWITVPNFPPRATAPLPWFYKPFAPKGDPPQHDPQYTPWNQLFPIRHNPNYRTPDPWDEPPPNPFRYQAPWGKGAYQVIT